MERPRFVGGVFLSIICPRFGAENLAGAEYPEVAAGKRQSDEYKLLTFDPNQRIMNRLRMVIERALAPKPRC